MDIENEEEYNKIKKDLDEFYRQLTERLTENDLNLVSKIVDLEIRAEGYCNQ